MEDKRLVTVTCINCQRRFSFAINAARRREVPYFGEDGQPLGVKRILAKQFAVPCPYCRIDNMVGLA